MFLILWALQIRGMDLINFFRMFLAYALTKLYTYIIHIKCTKILILKSVYSV